jgi:hypothetical protein
MKLIEHDRNVGRSPILLDRRPSCVPRSDVCMPLWRCAVVRIDHEQGNLNVGCSAGGIRCLLLALAGPSSSVGRSGVGMPASTLELVDTLQPRCALISLTDVYAEASPVCFLAQCCERDRRRDEGRITHLGASRSPCCLVSMRRGAHGPPSRAIRAI